MRWLHCDTCRRRARPPPSHASFSLLTSLGIERVEPAWIAEQWAIDRRGDAGYAVETVLGLGADGPVTLDLVSHGPHVLIGGTSGSGKSELLQAFVAGLLAYQSPRDVNLFFIDFKGGSASEAFKDMPHIAGRVTDLDDELAVRAQVALRAELRSRVSLFAGRNDDEQPVNDMEQMRRDRPNCARPHFRS